MSPEVGQQLASSPKKPDIVAGPGVSRNVVPGDPGFFVAEGDGGMPDFSPEAHPGIGTDTPGFIYAAQIDGGGPVKFGFSTDVPLRLKTLQEELPWRLRLLAVREGTHHQKSELLRSLHYHHLRSEWFEPHEDVHAVIGAWDDVANTLPIHKRFTRPWSRAEQPPVSGITIPDVEVMRPHVFAMQAIGAGDLIWIGGSWNLRKHVDALQSLSPVPLEMLMCVESSLRVGDALLEALEPYCVHGAWHRPDKAVFRAMTEVREYGALVSEVVVPPAGLSAPTQEETPDQVQALAHMVKQAFLHQHAQYGFVAHLRGGGVDAKTFLTSVTMLREARQFAAHHRGSVEVLCMWQRSFDKHATNYLTWRLASSTSECPGGCRAALPD